MPGPFLDEYQTRLDQLLKEQAGDLSAADKNAAIENAVREHSRYRAAKKISDLVGVGKHDIDLPGEWEENFSKMLSVEYPADEIPPIYLEDEDWMIYEDTTGQMLRLLNDTPMSLKTVRIIYSIRHAVTATDGTIPEGDFEAVCHYAAHFALLALANRYIQMTEPTLGADVVDHKSKAAEAASAAAREKKAYFAHLGIKEDETPAGFAFKDHDVNYPWGEDRLTHTRRWR